MPPLGQADENSWEQYPLSQTMNFFHKVGLLSNSSLNQKPCFLWKTLYACLRGILGSHADLSNIRNKPLQGSEHQLQLRTKPM